MSAGPNGPCPYPGEPSVTVTNHPCPPSWNDAAMLYEQVKKMPGPPSWKSDVITLKEAPTEPQTLYWRDLVESAHFLFVMTGSPRDGKALRGQQTWAQPLGWPLSHRVCWVVSELVPGYHT